MSEGGYLSDDYKPVFAIACFICKKLIGSTNNLKDASEIIFCHKCIKEKKLN
jgi:hypothetical protein